MVSVVVGSVVLVRHGETAWSVTGRHTGTTDVPLTPQGERGVLALRPLLRDVRPAVVWCSPRRRARRTAELLGWDPEVRPELAEWDYGGYEGRTTAEISAELGRPWSVWTDPIPGGESLDGLGARVDRLLDDIRRSRWWGADGRHDDGRHDDGGHDVVLVGHAHQFRVLAARWVGLPTRCGALLALGPASVSVLGHEHDRPVVQRWNVTR